MSRYALGRSFEYRVRKRLEDVGYFVVRSAGSKGAVDLVGLRACRVVLVQCKRDGALPSAEWNNLLKLADELLATPVLADMPSATGGVRFWELLGPKDGRSSFKHEWEP